MTKNPCHPDRCRSCEVDGVEYQVPRHISRVDIPGRNTHGWQVRFDTPSRFFPDDAGGRAAKTTAASLERAKTYLRLIWTPEPKRTRRDLPRQRGRVAGVRLVNVRRNNSRHWYVEATHPGKGTPRRFYYGTDRTKTAERKQAAMKQAIATRHRWLEKTPVPTR